MACSSGGRLFIETFMSRRLRNMEVTRSQKGTGSSMAPVLDGAGDMITDLRNRFHSTSQLEHPDCELSLVRPPVSLLIKAGYRATLPTIRLMETAIARSVSSRHCPLPLMSAFLIPLLIFHAYQ